MSYLTDLGADQSHQVVVQVGTATSEQDAARKAALQAAAVRDQRVVTAPGSAGFPWLLAGGAAVAGLGLLWALRRRRKG